MGQVKENTTTQKLRGGGIILQRPLLTFYANGASMRIPNVSLNQVVVMVILLNRPFFVLMSWGLKENN